jgi:hypothetical protein
LQAWRRPYTWRPLALRYLLVVELVIEDCVDRRNRSEVPIARTILGAVNCDNASSLRVVGLMRNKHRRAVARERV